jgi:hypothetical protein
MNWIKQHKWLTAGIVLGVIVLLYYLYKRHQANAAASANGTSGLPNFVYVGQGGGGGAGGGPIATGTQSSVGTPVTQASSSAAVTSANLAVIPGASPTPIVSAPAAENVASAIVNSPTNQETAQAFAGLTQNSDGSISNPYAVRWACSGSGPCPGQAPPTPMTAAQAAAAGWGPPTASQLSQLQVQGQGGLLPYQIYLQKQSSTTPVSTIGSGGVYV